MKTEFNFAQFATCIFTLFTLFGTPVFAQVKYVAVIETAVDAESGADKDINAAELREITSEIRRIAVNTLPENRFNVMTTETVLAMGEAVLAECAEENCVIALGNTIGADYIVRGIVSKFRQNFSLSVELFETENGMLIASAPSVRTANLDELLERGATACLEMYRHFMRRMEQQTPSPQTAAAPTPAPPPIVQPPPPPPPPPPATYRLTVNAKPAVGGMVKYTPVRQRYEAGTTITALAIPETGYRFTGWSGASLSTRDSIAVTMNLD